MPSSLHCSQCFSIPVILLLHAPVCVRNSSNIQQHKRPWPAEVDSLVGQGHKPRLGLWGPKSQCLTTQLTYHVTLNKFPDVFFTVSTIQRRGTITASGQEMKRKILVRCPEISGRKVWLTDNYIPADFPRESKQAGKGLFSRNPV